MSIKVFQKLVLVFYIHITNFALQLQLRFMSSYMSLHINTLRTFDWASFYRTLKRLLIGVNSKMVKYVVPLIKHFLTVIF
jgi:hypothetical protein